MISNPYHQITFCPKTWIHVASTLFTSKFKCLFVLL